MFYWPASIMHIFPALISKLRRDVNDDKEVPPDCTVDSNSGCFLNWKLVLFGINNTKTKYM